MIKTKQKKETYDYALFCFLSVLNAIFSGTFMLTEIYQGLLA